MRVLMIGAGDPAPTFIQRQVEALSQIGVSIDFLPPIKRPFWQLRLENYGFNFPLSAHITKIVQSADILHYQWPAHWLTLNTLALNHKKKTILSLRGRQINILPYIPGYANYQANLRRLLPRCDAFHAVSHAILAQAQSLGVIPERCRVIYTSIDSEIFKPAAKESVEGPTRIVMVGGLIWRKGYEIALSAFQKVLTHDSAVELVIAGDGSEEDRVRYTIQDLGIQNYVHLVGKLNPLEVRDLLQKSHIYLQTSLSEGIANSAIEAMSCGLPVVVTRSGGMAEAIDDGVEGYLVPSRDYDAIANALVRLLADPSLQKIIGMAGRARVLEQFSLSQQAQKFKNFYEWILAQ